MRPIEVTYSDVEKLIYQCCYKHHKHFGGDVDEMISVSNEAFMRAFDRYDPTKGKFTTFIVWVVRNALKDYAKAKYRHYVHSIHDTIGRRDRRKYGGDFLVGGGDHLEHGIEWGDTIKSHYRESPLDDFLGELHGDAKTVVDLILDTPKDIEMTAKAAGGHARNLASAVKKYLKSVGWTKNRIHKSFGTVSTILAN